MVDIHSHILSGIDDGAVNFEASVKMAKEAIKGTTTTIIATPHYCKGYGEISIEEIRKKVDELNNAIKKLNLKIEIKAGQEILFKKDVFEKYKSGEIGTLNNSRYMLFEFREDDYINNRAMTILDKFKAEGIIPIIAHPERYEYLIDEPKEINDILDKGYLFQLSASSITGIHGKEVQKIAKIFLRNKIYNFIGSDGHEVEMGRTCDLSNALKEITYTDMRAIMIFKEDGKKLLENKEVNFIGKEIIKKKRKSFFFK